MMNSFCQRKMLALLIMLSLLFVSTTESLAIVSINNDEKTAEQQMRIIEKVAPSNSINDDVRETNTELIADGYSSEITIPKDGDEKIKLNDGEGGALEFGLPENTDGVDGIKTANGTVIYKCNDDVSVGVQPLTEKAGDEQIDSVRVLITISDITAPHEYSFNFNLKDGERLVTAKEYMGPEYDTGEAYVINAKGEIESVIDPAWAKDANGNSVKTHYEVRGNSLIQIVEFNENTAFPVVADPTAWQITKCAGAISLLISSTIFTVAKIAKIKKYIKALGGIKKSSSRLIGVIKKAQAIAKRNRTSTVRVLRSAKFSRELWRGAGATLANFGASVLGVDTVIDNCSF